MANIIRNVYLFTMANIIIQSVSVFGKNIFDLFLTLVTQWEKTERKVF